MMQPACFGVHTIKPSRYARKPAAGIQRLFSQFNRHPRGLAEGFDAALLAPFLRNLVKRDFSLFDLLLRRDGLARVHRAFSHRPANRNKLTQQRQIVDLRGKITRSDKCCPAARQLGKIGGAAKRLHRFISFKLRLERHWIGNHVAIKQQQDRIVNPPMNWLIEMVGAQL